MSIPLPPTALDGDCSAIDNGTLYVLTEKAFQSLEIKENAAWSQETQGGSVQGPACVQVTPTGDNSSTALWVIGGQSSSGGSSAIQRYFFGNKTWDTVSTLADDVLIGRTNHSAVYLDDSQSILVYSGEQPDAPSYYSSQTFLISTVPPYNVQSYTSTAPPLRHPILATWNSSHALMVGGSPTNTEVWTFSPDGAWQSYGTNLSNVLDPSARAVVVDGTDGSKVLQVYTMASSPNTVSGIVLQGANGQPASTGQTVGSGSSSNSRKRKRDLTIQNWPSYNGSAAPTATRADCSIAQNTDGVVVMAGGNDEVPVIMFNQNENGWINAGAFFNAPSQQPLQPTASSTTAATSSASSKAAKATQAASGDSGTTDGDNNAQLTRELGITLGALFGFVALLVIFMLMFRTWHNKKRRERGYMDEKGDRMSFADRGASFMKEAAGVTTAELNPPAPDRYTMTNNSHSSLAIIAGRFGTKRNTNGHAQKSSYESTAQLVRDKNGQMMSEPMEMVDIDKRSLKGRPSTSSKRSAPKLAAYPAVPELEGGSARGLNGPDDRKRSSGWSKYFATSQPTGPNGLSHLPSAYAKANAQSMGSQYSTEQHKVARIPSSALVPPLDIDFSKTIDGQRLSTVASGSPSFGDSREDLAKTNHSGATSARTTNRKSQSASISSYGDRSTVGSTLNGDFYHDGSGESSWTPMTAGSFKDHINNERPTSSIYTASIYDSSNRKYSRSGKSSGGFFPGSGTSYKPPKSKSHSASSSVANPKVPDLPRTENRESTLSVFPKGIPSAYYVGAKGATSQKPDTALPKPVNTDMSWLNLGLNRGQS